MNLKRIVFDVGYIVDGDDQAMVDHALDCIYEDIMNAAKYNELGDWISIITAPDATEEDIPEFLLHKEEEEA
jgi:hypothetical protein